MSDYDFVLGNVAVIIMLTYTLGGLGMADDLGEDFSFDTDDLRFQLEISEPPFGQISEGFTEDEITEQDEIEISGNGNLTWTGETNQDGEDFGFIEFNVSERDDVVSLPNYDASGWFGNSISISLNDGETELISLSNPQNIDLALYDSVRIAINDVDSWVFIGSGVEIEDDRGPTGVIADTLVYGIEFVGEFVRVMLSWLGFAVAVGEIGVAGRLYQAYLISFLAFVAVREGWIG